MKQHRTPGQQARRVVKAIEAAGGEVIRVSNNGHLIVRGPAGVATIGAHSLDHARNAANTIATLARHCGLDIKL